MKEAKIHFSAAETDLMRNSEIILTKNSILQKVKILFENLQLDMTEEVRQHTNWRGHPAFLMAPKISKGENYLGLPYIVLDYPRQFDSISIFAVRTMFWWGHFFSSTLQLAGQYKTDFIDKIDKSSSALAKQDFYIGINDDPWVHHFEEDNYKKIKMIDEEGFHHYCHQFDHLKIAARWSLWDAHFVADELLNSWKFLVGVCLD